MADGVATDVHRRARVRLQVGHGLDARHAPAHRRGNRCTGAITTTSSPSVACTRGRRTTSCRCRTTRSCTARARSSPRCRATAGSSSPTCARCSRYQWASPGKKLLFMGGELAQWREWDHEGTVDWPLLDDEAHAGVQRPDPRPESRCSGPNPRSTSATATPRDSVGRLPTMPMTAYSRFYRYDASGAPSAVRRELHADRARLLPRARTVRWLLARARQHRCRRLRRFGRRGTSAASRRCRCRCASGTGR